MGHHRNFRMIKRYDTRLMYLNILYLMSVAFIPFPTRVLIENGNMVSFFNVDLAKYSWTVLTLLAYTVR